MNKFKNTVLALVALLAISACSPRQSTYPLQEAEVTILNESQGLNEQQGLQPGVVQYVWEEPVVDVIDVPPGLDPDGVYYRPAHKHVVEIRQGRWEYYKGVGAK